MLSRVTRRALHRRRSSPKARSGRIPRAIPPACRALLRTRRKVDSGILLVPRDPRQPRLPDRTRSKKRRGLRRDDDLAVVGRPFTSDAAIAPRRTDASPSSGSSITINEGRFSLGCSNSVIKRHRAKRAVRQLMGAEHVVRILVPPVQDERRFRSAASGSKYEIAKPRSDQPDRLHNSRDTHRRDRFSPRTEKHGARLPPSEWSCRCRGCSCVCGFSPSPTCRGSERCPTSPQCERDPRPDGSPRSIDLERVPNRANCRPACCMADSVAARNAQVIG